MSGDQHWAEIMAKAMPESAEYGPSVTLHEITASGIDQSWKEDIFNANRLRVRSADHQGNGVFDQECNFPFTYNGVVYTECTLADSAVPWCSTKTTSNGEHITGQWGNCLDKQSELFQSGSFSNENTCTDQLSHVCSAQVYFFIFPNTNISDV
jgi:alkaline phosphatase D